VAYSLAAKIASVLGGAVIPMENYYDPSVTVDDSNDFESIDFSLLIQNLQVIPLMILIYHNYSCPVRVHFIQ
jgi:hypothetical protein